MVILLSILGLMLFGVALVFKYSGIGQIIGVVILTGLMKTTYGSVFNYMFNNSILYVNTWLGIRVFRVIDIHERIHLIYEQINVFNAQYSGYSNVVLRPFNNQSIDQILESIQDARTVDEIKEGINNFLVTNHLEVIKPVNPDVSSGWDILSNIGTYCYDHSTVILVIIGTIGAGILA